MKAAVFIDVQNDFVKGGALAYGYPAESNTEKLIEFARDCRAKGYALYATQDTHGDDYMGTLEGEKLPVRHCVKGTPGHEIVDFLHKDADGNVVIPYGHVIEKPTFGSFDLVEKIYMDFGHEDDYFSGEYGEPLEEIILCGYDLAICVISNALLLRAARPNTKITIKKDLCGCISKETFDAAICIAKCCQIDIE